MSRVYILGPMRGKPYYNFNAFDNMAVNLEIEGHIPVNPAQLDRAAGFNPFDLPPDYDWSKIPASLDLQKVIDRDIDALRTCDAYVALEGWEHSTGARAEKPLLDWQGATRLDPATLKPWVQPLEPVPAASAKDESNPKDRIGMNKPQLDLVPPALEIWTAKAMENGAAKYGRANWRKTKVRLTVYIAAAKRHLAALLDGEDNASDSNLPHAAHVAACMGIILDAAANDCLIDDRPAPGAAARLIEQLTVKRSSLPSAAELRAAAGSLDE